MPIAPAAEDSAIRVRAAEPADRAWIARTLESEWGSTVVARRDELVDCAGLTGFVACTGDERVGLALVAVRGQAYEVVSVSSARRRLGVARALLERCFADARERGCGRVWLITTNNNIDAIACYQHVGMDLVALHRHAVRAARALKPAIPLRDDHGVPIDHELEFEVLLAPGIGAGPGAGGALRRQS